MYNVKRTGKPHGYDNTGAICYFSSLLQALQSCSAIRDTLVKIYTTDKSRIINNPLASYLAMIWVPCRVNISDEIVKKIGEYGPQDPHEYLLKFIDALGIPEVTRLFTYNTISRITCGSCGKKRSVKCSDMIYSIPTHLTNEKSKVFAQDKSIHPATIATYLGYNTATTDATVLCDKCNKRSVSFVENILTQPPDIFVISLNKYKKKEAVDIMDIFTLSSNSRILTYKRIAHIDHHPGHYVAVAIREDGKFYKFNDERITDATNPSAQTYLVFYALKISP